MNRRCNLFFVVVFFSVGKVFTQSKTLNMLGKVFSKDSIVMIQKVQVSILDLKRNLIINTSETDSEGRFKINFKKGNYHISFSSEMYETLMFPIDYSRFKNGICNLGKIELSPAMNIELDEITIVSKDYRIEKKKGKKIFHVGKGLKDVAGSMSNLLSYIPSVSVDMEGKIQLRGRSPIIKINGRSSNLSKADALQMLPSDMVKKIEIIRTPSAREGETEPIINIITDKKKKGIIGGINLGLGIPSTQKIGVHLALNKDKFKGYGLYGIKNENNIKNFLEEILESKNNSNYLEKEKNTNNIDNLSHFGEIQYEYFPNKRSELVGSVSIYNSEKDIMNNGYRNIFNNLSVPNRFNQLNENKNKLFSISKSIEYQLKFNKEKDLFKMEIEYEYENKNKREKFIENRQDNIQVKKNISKDYFKEDEVKLKLRFDKTLKNEGYFTIGYRLNRNSVNQNQIFNNLNPIDSFISSNNIKLFQYDNIAFVDYSNEVNNIYYNVGLRLKSTNRTFKNFNTNDSSTKYFLNLLPTLNLSYEYGNNNELSFNYYALLSQPRLSFLNSFNTSLDQQRIRVGNPDLTPQSTHVFELEHFKEFEKSTISTTFFSKFTRDVIQYVSSFDNETNRTISKPENIGESKVFGVDFSYSLNSPRWLNTIVKLNGKYGHITGSSEFYDLNSSFINIFRFNSYRLELSWFYNAPRQVNYQVREKSNQYFKFGISKRVFNNKGNLVLSVIDPFNSGRKIQEINDSQFSYESNFNPNQRRFLFSLFLRFNAKSKFRKTEKKIKEKGILK